MTNTTSNVFAGAPLLTGAAFRAPAGTAAPVDETTTLNVAFKSLGYVGEDGLTRAIERSVEKRKDWGGRTIKALQTEVGVTFTTTLIEDLNPEVQKSIYGDAAVTVTASSPTAGRKTAVAFNGAPLPRGVWAFEMKDGPARKRVVLPDAQITEQGEAVYLAGEEIGHEVTIECFPDASGNYFYEYSDDGVKSA